MTELNVAANWVHATLTGDATLVALIPGGVHNSIATADFTPPYIVFSLDPAGDVNGVGQYRLMSSFTLLARVIDQTTNYADIEAAAARMDVLLHRKSATVTSGGVTLGTIDCYREGPFSLAAQDEDGKQYRHLGGTYRVLAKGV